LVVGSGGREHALVWKIAQSPLVKKIYCAPGNPGIGEIAENLDIASSDLDGLLQFAKNEKIDLTVVGPEDPLVDGIVDKFSNAELKIFGPSKAAAQLEGSKTYSKKIMQKYKIPTAAFQSFSSNIDALIYSKFIDKFPIVLKASGLAAGKGVLICNNLQEVAAGINLIMKDKAFGGAGDEMIIEEFLEGEEVSIFALVDGENYKLLSPSQDHKRVFDNDEGKNTGGMGAYAPAVLVDNEMLKLVQEKILEPAVKGMALEDRPYRGVLYAGLMITKQGPKVVEFNCRFGDPETQVILPLMKNDIVPLLLACSENKIKESYLETNNKFAVCVIMASGGYPGKYEKGKGIIGLDRKFDEHVIIFHAGTKCVDAKLVTNGGRVLGVTALGDNIENAIKRAYSAVGKIAFDGAYYRKDIGYKSL